MLNMNNICAVSFTYLQAWVWNTKVYCSLYKHQLNQHDKYIFGKYTTWNLILHLKKKDKLMLGK